MKPYAFLLFLILAQMTFAQDPGSCYESHTIKSKALNEERSVWVGLPDGYNPKQSYSVLYVLDGEDRFNLTYTLTKELFSNQSAIPQLIVVGIPNIDKVQRIEELTFTDSKVNTTGKVDTMGYFSSLSTGQGLSFLSFLQDEVVPLIDKTYNTNDFNTLIGHSIGGYYCAYILPMQTKFSAFQIYDPSIWYNAGDAIKQIDTALDSNYKSHVFISKGTAFDGPRDYVENHLLMIDSLGSFLQHYPNLTVTTAAYHKDHNGMYLYSVLEGLSVLFKDVEYGFISQFDPITLADYQAFYQAASERLGANFEPPMDGIRWVAYANYFQENWAEALNAYMICYSAFENDIPVNMELTKCYEMLGNTKKQEYHQKKVEALRGK